jgi:hypothetical protein
MADLISPSTLPRRRPPGGVRAGDGKKDGAQAMKDIATALLPGVVALFLAASPAFAQDAAGNNGGVFIGGTATPAAPADQTCVEVEIGGQKAPAYSCINQRLQQQVQHVQPVANIPPLDASSPAVAVHGFNETAVQQQFGQNFGKSVVPFRPAAPTFNSSLH